MERLKRLIKNKTICIALHGKSIEELETNIEFFDSNNICWISVNSFDIIEDYILNKINKKLDIIYCGAYFFPKIEKEIRIPKLINAFDKGAFVIAKQYIFTEIFPQNGIDGLDKIFKKQLLFLEEVFPNNKTFSLMEVLSKNTVSSIGYLLCILSIAGAEKIILFGFDGLNEQTSDILQTYYKADIQTNRRILPEFKNRIDEFHEEYFCAIKGDTFHFNNTFPTYYAMCMEQFNISKLPQIFNCSLNSNFEVFEKISYNRAKELI